jgi:sugar O-acyltransferase (sialic acid O-acetyltransferase NeuD family)
MSGILIFPCNGNGLEALNCIGDDFEVAGFIDDVEEKQKTSVGGYRVFSRDAFRQFPKAKILAVPGSPLTFRERNKIIENLGVPDQRFASIIHPAAAVSSLAKIGFNVLIMAGVVITSNAIIGNHVCILPNTVVHHDVVIGDFTLIGSNVSIAGNTKIGENCYIGSGTSIMNGIEIGSKTLVGMGANVIRSFPTESKLAGNPARQL